MKVLVDTNVILDVLCSRKDFVADSLRIFQCCEAGRLEGCISALSIPNIVYIMRKELDQERIKDILRTLTAIFSVIDLRKTDILKVAELEFADYEDALQSVSAQRVHAELVVIRNCKDFTASPAPVITPSELLKQL